MGDLLSRVFGLVIKHKVRPSPAPAHDHDHCCCLDEVKDVTNENNVFIRFLFVCLFVVYFSAVTYQLAALCR